MNSREKGLSELTQEQKDGAKDWLAKIPRYVIKCVMNTRNKRLFRQYKGAYKDEGISYGR